MPHLRSGQLAVDDDQQLERTAGPTRRRLVGSVDGRFQPFGDLSRQGTAESAEVILRRAKPQPAPIRAQGEQASGHELQARLDLPERRRGKPARQAQLDQPVPDRVRCRGDVRFETRQIRQALRLDLTR